MGEKGTGKSSLIAKLLGEPIKEEMPPTTALDFKSGSKQREDKQEKVNVYELGGGRVLANLLSTVFVGNSIDSITIVLCVDLSKPGNSVENLLFWLKTIREQSLAVVQDMKERCPENLRGLQQRLKAKWSEHEDRPKV